MPVHLRTEVPLRHAPKPPFVLNVDNPITRNLQFSWIPRLMKVKSYPVYDLPTVGRKQNIISFYSTDGDEILYDSRVGNYFRNPSGFTGASNCVVYPIPFNATIACWIRLSAAPGDYGAIMQSRTGGGFMGLLFTGVVASDKPVFFDYCGVDYNHDSGLLMPQNEWCLVVGTHDYIAQKTITYFFNAKGVMFSEIFSTGLNPGITTTNSWEVAKDSFTARYVIGDFAHPMIWDRTLNYGEVRSLWDPATRWDMYVKPSSRVFFDIASSTSLLRRMMTEGLFSGSGGSL